jgi:Glutaminase
MLLEACDERSLSFLQSLLITTLCLLPIAASVPDQAQFILTKQQAADLFKVLRADQLIPFDYKDEGCFARAHQMFRDITKEGYLSLKSGTMALRIPTATA